MIQKNLCLFLIVIGISVIHLIATHSDFIELLRTSKDVKWRYYTAIQTLLGSVFELPIAAFIWQSSIWCHIEAFIYSTNPSYENLRVVNLEFAMTPTRFRAMPTLAGWRGHQWTIRAFSTVVISRMCRNRAEPVEQSHSRLLCSGSRHGQDSRNRQQTLDFCTQQCILGLQMNGLLDVNCPNVSLHRRGGNDTRNPVTAKEFINQLNHQLNEDIDHNCTLCGIYGAPFKVTCARCGYTLVGKGTINSLWKYFKR